MIQTINNFMNFQNQWRFSNLCIIVVTFSILALSSCQYDQNPFSKLSCGRFMQFNSHNSMIFSPDTTMLAVLTENLNLSKQLRIFNIESANFQQNTNLGQQSRLIGYSDSGPITYNQLNNQNGNVSIQQWTTSATLQTSWVDLTYPFKQNSQNKYIDITKRGNQTILAAFKNDRITEFKMYNSSEKNIYLFNFTNQKIDNIIFWYGQNYSNIFVYFNLKNNNDNTTTYKLIAYDCLTQKERFTIPYNFKPLGTRNNGSSVVGMNQTFEGVGDIIEWTIQNKQRMLIRNGDFLKNVYSIKMCLQGKVLVLGSNKKDLQFQDTYQSQLLIYNIQSTNENYPVQILSLPKQFFTQPPVFQCQKDKLAVLDIYGTVWIFHWNGGDTDIPIQILILIVGVGLLITFFIIYRLNKLYRTKERQKKNNLVKKQSSQITQNSQNILSSSILVKQHISNSLITQKYHNQTFQEKQQLSDQILARLLKSSFKSQIQE